MNQSVNKSMNSPMNPWLRGAVAVIAGGLLAGIIAVWVIPNEPAPLRARPDAVQEFLTRWQRWRRAEFVAEEITLRRNGERETSESVTIAQKWPDRVVRNGTAVSARVGSRVVGCTGGGSAGGSAGNGPVCLDTGGFDPPLELQMELDAIRAEVAGRTPRYRLTRTAPGCFRLRHVVDEFRSEFGDRVDYCFDPDPDSDPEVVVSETMRRGSLVESVTRRVVRREVGPRDLELPAPVSKKAG